MRIWSNWVGACKRRTAKETFIWLMLMKRALALARKNAEANSVSKCFAPTKALAMKCVKRNELLQLFLVNPPIRKGKKAVHEILEKSLDHLADAR